MASGGVDVSAVFWTFARAHAFEDTIDVVVLLNVIYVGISCDDPEGLPDLSLVFSAIYIIEYGIRLIVYNEHFLFKDHLSKVELLPVFVAWIGAFAQPDNKVLWRASVFRSIRIARALKMTRRSHALAELWLVLTGIGRAMKTMTWLLLSLLFITVCFGITVRGYIYNENDDTDLNTAVCGGDVFRKRLQCLDVDEYFGDTFSASITMLQALTLDRWAGHVVRPLARARPLAAAAIVCFVIVSTYCLLNVAVGVLVWSTVELAKVHDSHRERIMMVQDRELIHDLKDYFEATLRADDRDALDYKELQEAMLVPQVKHAYQRLNLPVTDLHQLWLHLDQDLDNEVSLEDFESGCLSLLEPAKRFDMACLSAKLNGRAAFGQRLSDRCDHVVDDLEVLSSKLSYGFAKMRTYVMSEDVNTLIPEVSLRQAGKMYIPPVYTDD
jgi:hypothetical protein